MASQLNKDHGTISTNATDQTLKAETSPGIYELRVDRVNMVNGDQVEIRGYNKILTGGTAHMEVYDIWSDKQGDGGAPGSSAAGDVVWRSGPIVSNFALTFTIKRLAGTDRAFDWVWDQLQ